MGQFSIYERRIRIEKIAESNFFAEISTNIFGFLRKSVKSRGVRDRFLSQRLKTRLLGSVKIHFPKFIFKKTAFINRIFPVFLQKNRRFQSKPVARAAKQR
jgi:hypothetical protein